jgi:hypothetical protein
MGFKGISRWHETQSVVILAKGEKRKRDNVISIHTTVHELGIIASGSNCAL